MCTCLDVPRRMATTPVQAGRSNSAIDLQAAQRAKARAQYAALARQKVGSGGSLRKLLMLCEYYTTLTAIVFINLNVMHIHFNPYRL